MGLFLTVNELCGEAVVAGQVRRVEYRDGALTIRGLDLPGAMAVLGLLGRGDLLAAKLSGVIPAPEVRAVTEAPEVPAPNCLWTSPQHSSSSSWTESSLARAFSWVCNAWP